VVRTYLNIMYMYILKKTNNNFVSCPATRGFSAVLNGVPKTNKENLT